MKNCYVPTNVKLLTESNLVNGSFKNTKRILKSGVISNDTKHYFTFEARISPDESSLNKFLENIRVKKTFKDDSITTEYLKDLIVDETQTYSIEEIFKIFEKHVKKYLLKEELKYC